MALDCANCHAGTRSFESTVICDLRAAFRFRRPHRLAVRRLFHSCTLSSEIRFHSFVGRCPSRSDKNVRQNRDGWLLPAQRPPRWYSNKPRNCASSIASRIAFALRPYRRSCSCVAIRFPFSVPAWFMCSIIRKSSSRTVLALRARQGALARSSRVSQTQGSSFGGR